LTTAGVDRQVGEANGSAFNMQSGTETPNANTDKRHPLRPSNEMHGAFACTACDVMRHPQAFQRTWAQKKTKITLCQKFCC
jgi:hypothetical protein